MLQGLFDGFASVYVGPSRLLGALAAFLLRGAADSASSPGLVSTHARLSASRSR